MNIFEYPFELGVTVYTISETGDMTPHIVSDYSVARNVVIFDDGLFEAPSFEAKNLYYTDYEEALNISEMRKIKAKIVDVIQDFPKEQREGKYVNYGWSKEELLILYAMEKLGITNAPYIPPVPVPVASAPYM